MPQKTLDSFFVLNSNKRKSEGPATEVSPKKGRSHVKENSFSDSKQGQEHIETGSTVAKLSLSPAQKHGIMQNKLKAQLKLACRQYPVLHENFGLSWYEALKEELSKPYFSELCSFVDKERSSHTVYPPAHQVYSWTHYSEVNNINVVILGQDPYHGLGQAHGLCFSVPTGIQPPPSLENMYRELQSSVDGFKHPGHGFLAGWARQGVLLLNACLTVRARMANSHKEKGWEQLTDAVIRKVAEKNKNVVFLLWGSYAQKKASIISKEGKHHLLHAPHPSPLSAHRGFLGCRHFSKCNELLVKASKKPINWANLPPA